MPRSCAPAAALVAALLAVVPATAAARTAHVRPGSAAQRSNVPGLTSKVYANAFVRRSGSRLTVAGRRFRFAGANVESLGLVNYGPNPSATIPLGSEKFSTKYELDDALATAHEMGATVVRAQTLGDTIGCADCLEPSLNHYNKTAFAHMDLAVAEARRYGIKLIGEFAGDANGTAPYGATKGVLGNASTDWYCAWRHLTHDECATATFSDPRLIGDYEHHMKAVLDHVNPYTGLAYKDDPTFAGWVDGNNLLLLNPTPQATFARWLTEVSSYFKSIDKKQLFIDISAPAADHLPAASTGNLIDDGSATPNDTVARTPGVDLFGEEWYPHFFPALNRASGVATEAHANAAYFAQRGKAYATIEFGWDHLNYDTPAILGDFTGGLVKDTNISGQLFWELVGHSSGGGYQPIPANNGCRPSCDGLAEDGNWWAFYYGGIATASNTQADMIARGQVLRTNAYRMDGFAAVPRHEAVGAPAILSTSQGHVRWQGVAGAKAYTIQKQRENGTWSTPCRGCANDAAPSWKDVAWSTADPGCYRIAARNFDGVTGPASAPVGGGCRRPSAKR